MLRSPNSEVVDASRQVFIDLIAALLAGDKAGVFAVASVPAGAALVAGEFDAAAPVGSLSGSASGSAAGSSDAVVVSVASPWSVAPASSPLRCRRRHGLLAGHVFTRGNFAGDCPGRSKYPNGLCKGKGKLKHGVTSKVSAGLPTAMVLTISSCPTATDNGRVLWSPCQALSRPTSRRPSFCSRSVCALN